MRARPAALLASLASTLVSLAHAGPLNLTEVAVCKSIAASLNGGTVKYALDPAYESAIAHYFTSSTQRPACVVRPVSPQDIAVVLQKVGSTRTPFNVKAGGHASNPGFSSTTGVHLDMTAFQQVNLAADKSYVDVGPSGIWDEAYRVLDGSGVNVVGGRVTGVGIGGFILGGGGFSWLTNQYGLTVDTVQSFSLVLPNGTLSTATATENQDLFFALKGGYQQFGIVYNIRLATVPAPAQVYAGTRFYDALHINAIANATTAFFQQNTDPKAQIITTFNALSLVPVPTLEIYYDAPTVPSPSPFAAFDALPALSDDVKTRSFYDFVRSSGANATANQRGAFHTVSVRSLTPEVLDVAAAQLQGVPLDSLLHLHASTFYSIAIEPFVLPGAYAKSQGGAFPHDASNAFMPINLYFNWLLPTDDAFFHQQLHTVADAFTAAAEASGQEVASLPLYPNYAYADTPPERLYGAGNLARLRAIRAAVDPDRVMSLATTFAW